MPDIEKTTAEQELSEQSAESIENITSAVEGDDEKKEYRKHRLSTGVLIIWLVTTAVLSIVIGGFAGAIIQKSTDERNFDIERNSLNEKISTLESSAEETQAELVELRELRRKLEELMTEYMILDTQRQAANVAAENASLLDENGFPINDTEKVPDIEGTTPNTHVSSDKSNSSIKKDDKEEPGGLFEWLMGTDKNENKDKNNIISNTKDNTADKTTQSEG